ncbi:MAG: tetratricopeptide repeat protein [Candidatus Krumholzibacteria bacterium]|nr:tetratricopeptide repeat protein [Candidatus Krumholzibacteria bacterium]
MDSKLRTTLEKALQDKAKGNFDRALKRLREAIAKSPDVLEPYLEAADVCLEGGESLQATQFLKKATKKFESDRAKIRDFAREKLRALGDEVLAKFLVEEAVRKRDLEEAEVTLQDVPDRTVRDLLQRTRTKRQSMTSAAGGGHSLVSEVVVNTLSEALMCLRLGRVKDGAKGILQILDEKPVENEVLGEFLAGLEKSFAKSGRVRFLYAVSMMQGGSLDAAMVKLVSAVRMEPELADESLERIRALTEGQDDPPEAVHVALVEILLLKGDEARAAELLQERLESTPSSAREVMETLRPHVQDQTDSLLLHWVYLDAALAAEQTIRVLEMVRRLQADESRRSELLSWLDAKGKEKFLPAEILMLQGELALEHKEYARAVEVLTAVCGASPNDIPSVLVLVERYKQHDPALEAFHRERSAERAESRTQSSGRDAGDFEHFENKEFSFTAKPPEKAAEKAADKAPEKPAEKAPAPAEPAAPATPEPAAEKPSAIENTGDGPFTTSAPPSPGFAGASGDASDSPFGGGRFSLSGGNEDGIVWEEEDERGKVDAAPEPAASVATTEAHVRHVADALYEVGARAFFHVEAEAAVPEAPAPEPVAPEPVATEPPAPEVIVPEAPSPEPAAPEPPAPEVIVPEAPSPEPVASEPVAPEPEAAGPSKPAGQTFEERVALIERAIEEERVDALGELVEFEPEDDDQSLERDFYRAEHHLLCSRPAAALALFAAVEGAARGRDLGRRAGLKVAASQRMMNDFGAAQDTLSKLLETYPGSEEIDRLAKQNRQQHLENQRGDALVLEKTTSLTTDL